MSDRGRKTRRSSSLKKLKKIKKEKVRKKESRGKSIGKIRRKKSKERIKSPRDESTRSSPSSSSNKVRSSSRSKKKRNSSSISSQSSNSNRLKTPSLKGKKRGSSSKSSPSSNKCSSSFSTPSLINAELTMQSAISSTLLTSSSLSATIITNTTITTILTNTTTSCTIPATVTAATPTTTAAITTTTPEEEQIRNETSSPKRSSSLTTTTASSTTTITTITTTTSTSTTTATCLENKPPLTIDSTFEQVWTHLNAHDDLNQYADRFRLAQITGRGLTRLSEKDIMFLGVTHVHHVTKILTIVKLLQENSQTTATTATATATTTTTTESSGLQNVGRSISEPNFIASPRTALRMQKMQRDSDGDMRQTLKMGRRTTFFDLKPVCDSLKMSTEKPLYEGILLKQSHGVWMEKYFTLYPTVCTYADLDETQKNTIPLDLIIMIKKKGGDHQFELSIQISPRLTKQMLLKSDDEEKSNNWFNAFNDAINKILKEKLLIEGTLFKESKGVWLKKHFQLYPRVCTYADLDGNKKNTIPLSKISEMKDLESNKIELSIQMGSQLTQAIVLKGENEEVCTRWVNAFDTALKEYQQPKKKKILKARSNPKIERNGSSFFSPEKRSNFSFGSPTMRRGRLRRSNSEFRLKSSALNRQRQCKNNAITPTEFRNLIKLQPKTQEYIVGEKVEVLHDHIWRSGEIKSQNSKSLSCQIYIGKDNIFKEIDSSCIETTVRPKNKKKNIDFLKYLHGTNGIAIKDRAHGSKTYECFVGSELVTWLIDNTAIPDREIGVLVGEELRVQGVFDHILNEEVFKDDQTLYRFCWRSQYVILPGSGKTVKKETKTAAKRSSSVVVLDIAGSKPKIKGMPFSPEMKAQYRKFSHRRSKSSARLKALLSPIPSAELQPKYAVGDRPQVLLENGEWEDSEIILVNTKPPGCYICQVACNYEKKKNIKEISFSKARIMLRPWQKKELLDASLSRSPTGMLQQHRNQKYIKLECQRYRERNTFTVMSVLRQNPELQTLIINGEIPIKDFRLANTEFINLEAHHYKDLDGFAIGLLLKKNTSLTKLVLDNNNISDDGVSSIAESLKINETLIILSISRNKIKDDGVKMIAASLMTNGTLKRLNLGDNNITYIGMLSIAEALKINSTLLHLCIRLKQPEEDKMKEVANVFAQNVALEILIITGPIPVQDLRDKKNTSLTLESKGYKNIDIFILASLLSVNNSLKLLCLADNHISDDGLQALSDSLVVNTTLETLDITGNYFTDNGVKGIAESLKNNTTLTELNISYNKITDVGVHHIVEALKVNTILKKLKIGAQIKDIGAKEMSALLKVNTTLKFLDMRGNLSIGSVAAENLAQSILKIESIERYSGIPVQTIKRNNTSLTVVHLTGTMCAETEAFVLASLLKVNETLTQMDLAYNGIADKGACALGDALKTNITLTKLDLRHNSIANDGACALANGLQKNIVIRIVWLENNRIGASGKEALKDIKKYHHPSLQELDV